MTISSNITPKTSPQSSHNTFKSALKCGTIASILAISTLAIPSESEAGRWYVNGDTIYYSGQVYSQDIALLRILLNNARAEGRTFRRVVFRNSPGGAANGGVGMGRYIREFGLDTVIEGDCSSACADGYASGVNRYVSNFDLPGQIGYSLEIHGSALNGVPVADQEEYIDYYRRMIGPEAFAIAGNRIIQAHYELINSGGFLYYKDPNKVPNRTTYFCPTNNTTSSGNCTEYPNVSIHSDRLATGGYFAVNDKIYISNAQTGPVRTNFETYNEFNDRFYDISPFYVVMPDLVDRYSTVVVLPGGDWKLNAENYIPFLVVDGGKLTLQSQARLRETEGLEVRNGGLLHLDNGSIHTHTNVINLSVISGKGSVHGSLYIKDSIFAPTNITLYPYELRSLMPASSNPILRDVEFRFGSGRVTTLHSGSSLVLNVDKDAKTAPINLVQARYYTMEELRRGQFTLVASHRPARLDIDKDSKLILDFNKGYYDANQRINLVSRVIDDTRIGLSSEFCRSSSHLLNCQSGTNFINSPVESAQRNIVSGRFTKAGYLGQDPANFTDTSKDGAQIHAAHNSLLTFSLFQNSDGIHLIANPAFEDVTLFRNKQSGNGLGEALKAASWEDDTRLEPVLGALQFTDKNVARRQASSLRGDGYSSLRLIGRSIIDQFSDALFTARQTPGGSAVNSPLAIAETLTLPGDRGERMGIGGGYAGTAVLSSQPAPEPRSPYDLDAPTQVFATGFGHLGVLHGQHRISRVEYNGFGTLIGASRELNRHAQLGGAVGFGQTRTNSAPVNSFTTNTDTVVGALFADISHDTGSLSIQGGYARINHEATRYVFGIEGLESPSRAKYDNHAYFARLEHGLDLTALARGKAQVTLLAPVVDYVHLSDARVNEKGKGPHNLRVENETYESLRAGLGLQLERRFEAGEQGVTPYARLVYQRELWDREATSTNRFRLATHLPFDAVSRELGEDSLEWNLGLRTSTNNQNLKFALEYQGRAVKGETGHGAQASLSYRF